jgi:hypothetical protein
MTTTNPATRKDHTMSPTTLNADHNITCQSFAMCDRPATGAYRHPILGAVLSCQRCADKLEQTLRPVVVSDLTDTTQLWYDFRMEDNMNTNTNPAQTTAAKLDHLEQVENHQHWAAICRLDGDTLMTGRNETAAQLHQTAADLLDSEGPTDRYRTSADLAWVATCDTDPDLL